MASYEECSAVTSMFQVPLEKPRCASSHNLRLKVGRCLSESKYKALLMKEQNIHETCFVPMERNELTMTLNVLHRRGSRRDYDDSWCSSEE